VSGASFHLPAGWDQAQLGDVLSIRNGFAFKSKEFLDEGVLVVRQGNLGDGTVTLKGAKFVSREYLETYSKWTVRYGDILIGMSGSLGKLCTYRLEEPALQNQRTGVLEFFYEELKPYIKHFLVSVADLIANEGKGVAVQNVSAKQIEAIQLPLAPLPEQHRIVAKLDALFAHSRKAKQALEAIPPLLERYRQSVLAAACSGRLTAEWRKQNPDVEPAEKLLERIRVGRRKRWEEAELTKMAAKGKVPKNDKWKGKYKEPEPVDTEGLPELPGGWVWEALEALTPVNAPIVYGIIQPGPQVDGGVPYIRPKEIANDEILPEPWPRTSPEIAKKYARAALVAGDIILSIVGTIGKVAVVPLKLEGGNITQSSARIRPWDSAVHPEFLTWTLRSHLLRTQFDRHRFGNAVQRLNIAHVRALAVPVPPRSEQKEISRLIPELLERVAGARCAVQRGSIDLDVQTASTLSTAFQGKLVPQDPNDEPASVLLERIRAEREAQAPKKGTRGRKRKART
jgi:type I restriction enzyme S subunit